jgi:DUF1680 family protein
LNGEELAYEVEKGYAVLKHSWKKGDILTLNLPMEVRKIRANEKVEEKRGLVAVELGPIVYCAEEADNSSDVLEVKIDTQDRFSSRFEPALLGGVNVVEGAGLSMIPYYSWANREIGKMNVWFMEE